MVKQGEIHYCSKWQECVREKTAPNIVTILCDPCMCRREWARWQGYARAVFPEETDLKSARCTKTSRADTSASLTRHLKNKNNLVLMRKTSVLPCKHKKTLTGILKVVTGKYNSNSCNPQSDKSHWKQLWKILFSLSIHQSICPIVPTGFW